MELQELIHRNMVKDLVRRAIWCPITGDTLDVRTCVVLLGRDELPLKVISPRGWHIIAEDPEKIARLSELGAHVDPSTVRSPDNHRKDHA
jgi:hypothetical protein